MRREWEGKGWEGEEGISARGPQSGRLSEVLCIRGGCAELLTRLLAYLV